MSIKAATNHKKRKKLRHIRNATITTINCICARFIEASGHVVEPSVLALLARIARMRDHIVNLQDHTRHLSGKQNLLLLAKVRVEHTLRLHVVCACYVWARKHE